ncbi:hypothetical protein F5Y13DRAFT_189398 [Hypoxylon sp. FL1857]|nr:hypothetical protein F5Y13DRAFT_189398 [Hypoxylon sp. FL1857]
MSSGIEMSVPDPLGEEEAKEYIEANKENLREYLGARVGFVEDLGYFFSAFDFNQAYLVIILSEDCPYRPDEESRNWDVEDAVIRALTDNRPLPSEPAHTLLTMFANYVMVRKDTTAESGYSIVAWPEWIRTPNGEYGGKKANEAEKAAAKAAEQRKKGVSGREGESQAQ